MLRHKPKFKYCGLTVILANPSRLDKTQLLSGVGAGYLLNGCLQPTNNTLQCDVRLVTDPSPLLPDTKCILALGEDAIHRLCPESRRNSLNEIRGSVYNYCGIPTIPSYFPQDCVGRDVFENLEVKLNPLNKYYQHPDSNENFTPEDEEEEDVKRHGRTSRKNFSFWLRADVKKCQRILGNAGVTPTLNYPKAIYHVYPTADEVINLLENTKGQFLYFDIETDYEEQNFQCFAFSFDGINIHCVPILDYSYQPSYSGCHYILRALAIAFHNNTLVAHNGAGFDFFVLGYKYRIAINRVYDTMIAMFRCFPDVEKSLGHCTSYWTWEHFHKDEDSLGYRTKDQMMKRLEYCGKDVYTMFLIHQEITKYAKTVPGLTESIECAMDAIRPYVTMSLKGISFDPEKVRESAFENDRLMEQYDRIIKFLIGPLSMLEIQGGKDRMFAGSNKQVAHYLHDMLGYSIIMRTDTGAPSVGKKTLYKLALKHEDNPVIQFILAYRTLAKEYGTYKFIPWTDDKGNRGKHSVLEDATTNCKVEGNVLCDTRESGVQNETVESSEVQESSNPV
jgi:hypothetical protein